MVSVKRQVWLGVSLWSIFNVKQAQLWVYALIAVTVLWGWSFSAIHQALQELSASAFNAFRFIIGAVVMLPFVAKKIIISTRADWFAGSLAGVVLFLAFSFQTAGIAYTTPSNAAFITGLAVIFTPFLAKVLLNQNPKRQQIAGAALAAIGLAMLTIHDLSVHKGDAFVLACAVFTALHIIVLAKASQHYDAVLLTFIQVFIVALLSFLWALFSHQIRLPHSVFTFYTLAVMGIFGTALAYFVQTKAQLLTSPNKIALILVLEPVFGGLFGYLLAGDRLTNVNMMGALFIILAMVITEIKWRPF